MRELTNEIKEELRKETYQFLAEESDMEVQDIKDDMSVMEDLDGDSLMFVELVEILKKKYNLNIQLQEVGKYLLKHPANTVSEVIETLGMIYQYESKILEIEG